LHQPVLRVEVGRADAGAADLDHDIARSDGLGLGRVDQLERLVVLLELRRSHTSARWSASLRASAMIVRDGLTDSVRGMSELSPTYRFSMPCTCPLRSVAERSGSSPIRQEPWTCVEAIPVHPSCFAPAARRTSLVNSRAASIRPTSRSLKAMSNRSIPLSSTTTDAVFSSFTIATPPFRYR